WQPIHYGLGRASIGSLVLDPQDVKVLYAGTSSGGVYKTTDGGEHWQETNQGLLYERQYAMINVLAMTQQDVRHLYHTDGNNLFETENGGESWQKIEAPICPNTGGSIILAGLVVHPTHPQTLFALDHKCTGGVYQSTDGGKTWTPTSAPRKFGGNWLGIDRSAGDNLYFNSNEGLYGSTDGGDSWRWLLQSDCPAFAIHPDIPAVAICGTRERSVIKTADGGKTWQTVAQLALAEITAITFSPKTPSTIYVGGQGVYASTDEGRTWTARSSGLGGVRLELKLDPTGRSLLYAQESLCGYYASPRLSRSLDEGRTWETVTKEGCGLEFDADGTTLYRLAWDEILRSQDEGKTWTKITTPFAERIGGLTAHPHQPRTLYALSLYQAPYIFVSGDGGDTWQSTTGIQGGAERIFFGNEQTPVAYATDTTTIHRSTDGGSTWTRCSQTYVGYAQSDSRLVIDPRDGNRVILATRSAGILISKSGCIGWQPSNTGLGSLFVNTVAIDPNNPGTLYVGTDGGAYVSFDGGEHWGQVNDGLLGALVVYSIVLDKDSNVYAATPYGIFKLEGK
ncbi:MAG: hypothetical protein U1B80_02590, partial [Anaerolineaceae bacterium]|nr:hypothetical protein [Anaerolineaceae bacterium]